MEKSTVVNNDKGFVLVVCLLIFMVLSIGGIMVMQNANTEVQISGNERSIKNNMYQAEGTSHEGAQCIDNEASMVDLRKMGDWMERISGTMSAADQQEMDNLEEGDDEEWDVEIAGAVMNETCISTVSGIDDGSETIAKKGYGLGIAKGSSSGSSLKMTTDSAMYSFKIIGISSQNVGEKTVEIGFRKRLDTSEQ